MYKEVQNNIPQNMNSDDHLIILVGSKFNYFSYFADFIFFKYCFFKTEGKFPIWGDSTQNKSFCVKLTSLIPHIFDLNI